MKSYKIATAVFMDACLYSQMKSSWFYSLLAQGSIELFDETTLNFPVEILY